jgi:TPR repeat protein
MSTPFSVRAALSTSSTLPGGWLWRWTPFDRYEEHMTTFQRITSRWIRWCAIVIAALCSFSIAHAASSEEIEAAAERGDANAQFELAELTRSTKGPIEAIKWYQKAARQGHPKAQHQLGLFHRFGVGVPLSKSEAAKWYRKAAEQGYAPAQNSLAHMYSLGWGVKESEAEATKWYLKAALQGHADSQYSLGLQYENGDGVPASIKDAIEWYRKAAEQGHPAAQEWLGIKYTKGEGVLQDYKEAVKWYEKSAEQGYAAGQCSLAFAYYVGHGVPRDLVAAYMWVILALSKAEEYENWRFNAMGLRDDLQAVLTVTQIEEAQARAKAWTQKH